MSAFKEHCQSSSNKQSFSCSYCSKLLPYGGKAFAQSSAFRIHLKCRKCKIPFACKICGRLFTQEGSLLKHIAMKSCTRAERKFRECTRCC